MKKSFLLILGVLITGGLYAQIFSVEELLSFDQQSSKKLEAAISKKGFVSSGKFFQSDSIIHTWDLLPDASDSNAVIIHRRIARIEEGKQVSFFYQSALYPEVTSVVKQLQHLGFTGVDTNWAMQKPMVMQKLDWSFIAEKVKEEDNEVLMLSWRRKQLPSAGKKIILEDLLQFTSDEYLAARFGRENVRKDRFYFSETEVNRCSVLFPNTPNQVIFVWNDAELLKDIVQIMVGGTVRAESMQGYEGTIEQHKWILQNGISTQVRLEQLQKSLDQDIFFFGRKHDFYLSLTPESAKLMGLENGTLVFECINSAGAKLLDQEKISARAAIDAGLKLHVSLIVLWPAE